ncbi:MAG: radical SAM protein [Candidatus Altiarchaeales archaeon]|nr:radical SAM protein [Candidatus Altiarchaeales archaeon]MBD3416247.1 radical SAM protein [Candidatus Altiarchaeales archaeon]
MDSRKTESLCPVCFERVAAEVFNEGGKMYISQECPEHGSFKTLHFFEDPRLYAALSENMITDDDVFPDGQVLKVTMDCNMDCPFCAVPKSFRNGGELTVDEILDLSKDFKGSLVYLCGGEPTIREDLPEIITRLRGQGKRVAIFTNGIRFSEPGYAGELKEAGLNLVILSFLSFDRGQSLSLYGCDVLDSKLKALENLAASGMPTMLSLIVFKGVNEDQVSKAIEYGSKNSGWLRLVNFKVLWDLEGKQKEIILQNGIVDLVSESTDITLEDILGCTLFSNRTFEILRLITGKGGIRTPRCELRCYFWVRGGRLVPISRMIDLNELIKNLDFLRSKLKSSHSMILTFFLWFPYSLIVRSFISNPDFRMFCLLLLPNLINDLRHNYPLSTSTTKNIFGITVERYMDPSNVDFEFSSTCNICREVKKGKAGYCIEDMKRWHYISPR